MPTKNNRRNTIINLFVDYQLAYAGSAFVPGEQQLSDWLNTTLAHLQLNGDYELSVRIVDDAEITELNQTYRNKAGATNVLSFPFDNVHDLPLDVDMLGDIVIAADVISKEAEEQQKKVEAHWAHICIHGLLHLLGYDHIDAAEAEEMESLEIAILAQLVIENPYL